MEPCQHSRWLPCHLTHSASATQVVPPEAQNCRPEWPWSTACKQTGIELCTATDLNGPWPVADGPRIERSEQCPSIGQIDPRPAIHGQQCQQISDLDQTRLLNEESGCFQPNSTVQNGFGLAELQARMALVDSLRADRNRGVHNDRFERTMASH